MSIEMYFEDLEKVFGSIVAKTMKHHDIPWQKVGEITWTQIVEYMKANVKNSIYIANSTSDGEDSLVMQLYESGNW